MRKILLDAFLITFLTYLLLWSIVNIPLNLEALNPLENLFQDFDLTDIVYSQLREDPQADQSIVVVNIGKLDRAGVAEVVNVINRYSPKIIGIDAFFRKPLEPQLDSALAQVFAETKNLVLVSELAKPDPKKKRYDSLETSNPMFNRHAVTGFANLITKGEDNMTEFLTCRHFSPVETAAGKKEYAFALKIAQIDNPEAAKICLERKNDYEFINYKGNIGLGEGEKAAIFTAVDFSQILDSTFQAENAASVFKDKIVIMGYMGESLGTKAFEDKFYTPLNKNYVGKSTPDMFGVVVHANIVSMILNKEYINELNDMLNFVFSFIFTYLCVVLFVFLYEKSGYWFEPVTIVSQLFITVFLIGVTILAFKWYRLRVDVTYTVLAIVVSGILVEIYKGVISKTFAGLFKQKIKVKQLENETR